ncbi:MAG: hypothetical protein KA419_09710 [Acidobacteria bacterium]|nr:hypothetical protein [Acidobacteriota bacterium]
MFSSDGSSLAPFSCHYGTPSPTVDAAEGNPAPSLRFTTTTFYNYSFAPYTLPHLNTGERFRGRMDFKFYGSTGCVFLCPGTSISASCNYSPVTGPAGGKYPFATPYYDVASGILSCAYKDASLTLQSLQATLSLTPGTWHASEYRQIPNPSGGYDFEVWIDGSPVLSGRSYESVLTDEPLGVGIGAACSGSASNVFYDNLLVTLDNPPSIQTHPQSQPIGTGQTASLSVSASGTAPLHYAWYQGASGDTSTPAPGGGDASSYTTPVLTSSQSYWVRVSNEDGVADSNTAVVTVNQPPVIPPGQPEDKVAAVGQTATLCVTASGEGPLHYQWYQGASGSTTTPVGTDAACFTTPPLGPGTVNYWVRVSNAFGHADSRTARVSAGAASMTCTYDALNRLTGVTYSDGTVVTYAYDAAGNMTRAKIDPAPRPKITGPADVCAGGSVTLDAGAGFASYLWSTGAATQSVTVSPAATAYYTVSVTDGTGRAGTSPAHTVTVNPLPTPAVTGPAAVCAGGSATLDAGAGYASYAWSTGATTQTVQVSPATTTDYTVTVTSDKGCTGTSPLHTVTVNPLPALLISGPTAVCAGASATLDAGEGYAAYAWSTGAATRTISVSPAAPAGYTVTVTTAAGCTGTSPIHVVTVNPLPAPVITGPAATCAGAPVTLDAGAGYASYAWSTGATTRTVTVSPSATTGYTVTVTNGSGCVGASPVHTVTVNPAPAPVISGPTSVCAGSSVTLDTGAGFASYAWSTGATTQTITVSPTTLTSYTVTVTNADGCPGTSPEHPVTVDALTALSVEPRCQTLDTGQTVTFTAGAAGAGLHYQWYQGETGDTATPVGTDSPAWTTPALSQSTPYWLRVSGSCGTADSHTCWATIRQSASTAPFDFNGDGNSDILWQADADGTVSAWYLDAAGLAGTGTLGAIADPSWQVAGVSDFNGDGVSDVLWRKTDTGDLAVWLVDGTGGGVLRGYSLGNVDPSWKIVGVGDADLDGRADIFWRNDASGIMSVWFTCEGASRVPGFVGGIGNLDWRVLGVDDFNGDGKADIFWRHLLTGDMSVWFVTETGYAGNMSPGSVDPSWKIVGFGDADLDGRADIFWRHNASGTMSLWFIDETGLKGTAFVGGISDLDWVVKGIGDFGGDGKADILWRYMLTGDLSVWFVTEAGYVGNMSPGAVGLGWKTLNLVNFNREGDGAPSKPAEVEPQPEPEAPIR